MRRHFHAGASTGGRGVLAARLLPLLAAMCAGCAPASGCGGQSLPAVSHDAGIGVNVVWRRPTAASRFGSTGRMFSAVMELDLLMLDERVTAPEVGGWRARLQFNAGRLASDDENPIYISSMVEPWPSQVYRDVNELWVSATEHDKLVYGLALQSGGRTHAYREVSEVFLSLRDGRWVQGSFQLGPVHPRPREMHIASDPYPGELSELARELEPDTDWVEFHCPLIVRCWRLQGDDTEYVEEADWSSNQCTTAAVELGLEGWLPESHPAYHDAYERSFHPW